MRTVRVAKSLYKGSAVIFALTMCLVILASSSFVTQGAGYLGVSNGDLGSVAAAAVPSHSTDVLGTDYTFYSTTFHTYVSWSQTVYADSANYFPDHIDFTNAGLGSATSPAWSFGVGVSGSNLTISQITSSYIELDDKPTARVNVYFYYFGGSPLKVTVGSTTISAGSFLSSATSFSSCTNVCVYLNQGSQYIEIANPAGNMTKNLVYPGTPPATTTVRTTSTSTAPSPSPSPPPQTTTTIVQSTTGTQPPPPPPVTTTVQSTTSNSTTYSATSNSTTSNSTTETSTNQSSSSALLTTSTQSSTRVTTTESTPNFTTSSSSVSTTTSQTTTISNTSTTTRSSSVIQSTTSQVSNTSQTVSNSTQNAVKQSFVTMLVSALGVLPFLNSSHNSFGIPMYIALVAIVTAGPIAIRRTMRHRKGSSDWDRWHW